MAAFYSVLQYLPDPVCDERINIGVLVFGEGEVHFRVTEDWNRVKTFGVEDIEFLRDFATDLNEKVKDRQLDLFDRERGLAWQEDIVRELARTWINSIQFTEPRGSLESPAHLLEEVARRFLRSRGRRRREPDRRAVAKVAASELETALCTRFGDEGRRLLGRGETIPGAIDQHRFDVVVRNGTTFFAVQGLSFTVADLKEVEATAWAIDDVKTRDESLPLAVVYLPPGRSAATVETFERARRIFRGLKSEFVPEEGIREWARDAVAVIQI